MTPRTSIDDFNQEDFQRFALDLLLAEFAGSAIVTPRDLGFGVPDGGSDGRLRGEFRGVSADWRVQVKKIEAAGRKPPHQRLAALLADERRRLEGRLGGERLLVVSNTRLTEAQERHLLASLHDWAPGAEVVDGAQVDLWARKQPHVARSWGLNLGDGGVVFRSVGSWLESFPRDPEPLAVVSEAVTAMLAALAAGREAIWVAGDLGSGRSAVLAEILHRWWAGDALARGAVGARVPVVLDPAFGAQVQAACRGELHLDRTPYLFIVPPLPDVGKDLPQAVSFLAALSRRSPGSRHAFIAACHPSQRDLLDMRWRAAGGAEPAEVTLRAPDTGDLVSWLRRQRPDRTDPALHRAVAAAKGSPCLALAILEGVEQALARLGAVVLGVVDEEPSGPRATPELLLRLVLRLPYRWEDPVVEQIATVCGVPAGTAQRVLDAACEKGLVAYHPDGRFYGDESDIKTAAVLRCCLPPTRSPAHQRLLDDLGRLDDDQFPKVVARLYGLTDLDDVLLPWIEREERIVREEGPLTVSMGMDRLAEIAVLSVRAASRALDVVEALMARLERGDPFPPEAWSVTFASPPNDGWYLCLKVQGVLGSCRVHTALVERTVRGLLRLSRIPDSENHLQLQAKVAASLVHPLLPEAPRRLREASAVLLRNLEGASEDEATRTARLAAAVARVWLAGDIEADESAGNTFFIRSRAWKEANPEIGAWRRTAMDLLLAVLDTPWPQARVIAWEAFSDTGEKHSAIGRHGLSDGVLACVEEAIRTAGARFPAMVDWSERVAAERLVLDFVGTEGIPTELIAATNRLFSREPDYLAWRLMARSDRAVIDPEALAVRVAGGARCGETYRLLQPYLNPESDLLDPVVTGLVAKLATSERVLALLTRVAAEPGPGSWEYPVILRKWVEAAPALFEPILAGALWPRVPNGARASLLWAAASAVRAGMIPQGRASGAAAHVAELLAHPMLADPTEVRLTLHTLHRFVLPEAQRAPALFGLAGHSDAGVRATVAHVLLTWLLYGESQPNPLDAVAIIRALGQGESGEDATWLLADELGYERVKLAAEVRSALGEVVSAHLAAGRRPEGEFAVQGAARFLADILARDSEAWFTTARAHLTRCDPRHSPAIEVISCAAAEEPVPVDTSLLTLIARELLSCEGAAVSWWEEIGARVARHLPPGDALALASALLDEGDVRAAGVILLLHAATLAAGWIGLLARTLHALEGFDSEAAEVLADRVCLEWCSDPWSPGPDAAVPFVTRARLLREVADGGPEGAGWLHRIASSMEAEGRRRSDPDWPMG